MSKVSIARRVTSAFPLLAQRSFSSTPHAQLARMNIIGRLGTEPELVATSTGRELIRYVIGTSSGSKENRHTSWFRVTSFDENPQRREYILNQPKGTLVHVEAEARINLYEDPNAPEKKRSSNLDLVQRSFEALSRPSNTRETGSTDNTDGELV